MFNEFLPDAPQKPSWFALSGNTVLSRQTYDRFGPFDPMRAAEDVLFSRRVVGGGGTVLFYPRLKVLHDNRTNLLAFVKNQFLLGRYTTMARRLVPFADLPRYPLFLLLLPVGPVAKLVRILVRLMRWKASNPWRVLKELPLLSVGLGAYWA